MRKLILTAAITLLAACGPEEAANYDDADEAVDPAVTTRTVDPAATTTAPNAGASVDTAGMSGTQRATGTDADGPGQVP